jgi:hypothetical protein
MRYLLMETHGLLASIDNFALLTLPEPSSRLSGGQSIALALAFNHPDMLRGIVLAASAAPCNARELGIRN